MDEHAPGAIKAAYGGGGRGMRVVQSADEAAAALESAQSEALKGFGRAECYVERYLTWPRHIEMQVFADTHGNAVWLGERDCSAQRRHQKLIEESPAPGFPDEVRQAMGEAAVKVTRACGYVNAGTVEFLYQDGEFTTGDEHPSSGRAPRPSWSPARPRGRADPRGLASPLSIAKDDILRRGTPSSCASTPRTRRRQVIPPPAPSRRCGCPRATGCAGDGGYEAGDEISSKRHLVGKLVCWGADRDVAIARTIRALDEFVITGLPHHPGGLAILRPPTSWRASTRPSGSRRPSTCRSTAAPAPTAPADGDEAEVAEPKVRRDVDVECERPAVRRDRVGARSAVGAVVAAGGAGKLAQRPPARAAGRRRPPAAATLPCPCRHDRQGARRRGRRGREGQTVCVLEAMKMENNIAADQDGTITDIKSSGQSAARRLGRRHRVVALRSLSASLVQSTQGFGPLGPLGPLGHGTLGFRHLASSPTRATDERQPTAQPISGIWRPHQHRPLTNAKTHALRRSPALASLTQHPAPENARPPPNADLRHLASLTSTRPPDDARSARRTQNLRDLRPPGRLERGAVPIARCGLT